MVGTQTCLEISLIIQLLEHRNYYYDGSKQD